MPAENPQKEQPNSYKPQWPRYERKQGPIAGIAAFINAYRNEQKTNREQEGREDRGRKRREWATLTFVILTTIGIFIQAIILNSTDKAVNIANTEVQRAFVSFDIDKEESFIVEDGKIIGETILARVYNTGNTPTKTVHLSGACPVQEHDMVEPWGLLKTVPLGKNDVFIGAHFSVPFPCNISTEQFTSIAKGLMFGYFIVQAEYSDRLSPNVIRKTEAEFKIITYGVSQTISGVDIRHHLLPTGAHNCADEDCPDYKQNKS